MTIAEESDLVRPTRQVKLRKARPEVAEIKKKSSPLFKYIGKDKIRFDLI